LPTKDISGIRLEYDLFRSKLPRIKFFLPRIKECFYNDRAAIDQFMALRKKMSAKMIDLRKIATIIFLRNISMCDGKWL